MVKDREAWSAAVHGVTKNRTWLSGWKTTRTHYIKCWLAFYSLQSFKDPSAIKCSHHIKLCCKTKEQREIWWYHQFSSVQFSHSVMSDSLGPHESQYTRLPCPSPTRGVYPNSRPSSQWCHPAMLTQTTGPSLEGQKQKARKNSTFFKERIQLFLKPGKRRPQTQ